MGDMVSYQVQIFSKLSSMPRVIAVVLFLPMLLHILVIPSNSYSSLSNLNVVIISSSLCSILCNFKENEQKVFEYDANRCGSNKVV